MKKVLSIIIVLTGLFIFTSQQDLTNVLAVDFTAPTFDTIPTQTIQSGDYTDIDWTTYIQNLYDNVDPSPQVYEEWDEVDYNTPGTYSVQVRAVDNSNNVRTQQFDVIVEDTHSPSFSFPSSIDLEATHDAYDITIHMTNQTDNSDGVLTSSIIGADADYNTPGMYQVTVRLTDESGNYDDDFAYVWIEDATPPTFDTIPDDAIGVGGSDIDWSIYITNIVENTDLATDKFEDEDNIDYDTLGTYTVTVALEDAAYNVTYQTFSVSVVDTTAPTFNSIVDQVIEAGEFENIDWESYITNPVDNSDGTLLEVEVTDNVIYNNYGEYTVTVKLVDESLNETSTTFNVFVDDTISPTFDSIVDQVIEVGLTDIDWTYLITNELDNNVAYILVKVEVEDNVDYNTPGTYTVTVKVVDETLNETSVTFNVTVNVSGDNVAPTFDMIVEQTIEAGILDIDWTTYIVNEYDNFEGVLTKVEAIDNIDYSTVGSYSVTVKLVDESLNETEQIFNVIVVDTTAPIVNLELGLDTIYLEGNHFDSGMTFTDNVLTEAVTVVTNLVDTSTLGEYLITYTVTDASGNETIAVRYVNVLETSKEVVFDLEDAKTTYIIGDTYEDSTCTVTIDGTTQGCNELSNNVDTSLPGIYEIVYSVEVDGIEYTKTRYVFVTITGTDLTLYYIKEEEELLI